MDLNNNERAEKRVKNLVVEADFDDDDAAADGVEAAGDAGVRGQRQQSLLVHARVVLQTVMSQGGVGRKKELG
jgi:hypothetical protein